MKKIFKLTFVFVLAVFVSGSLFSNGLNLNGVGTKANSMGGAFIGLADDYSAVYWNPAGLTQMKEQSFAVYGSFLIPKGTYKLSSAGIDTQTKSAVYPSGAIGYFKPLSDKLVVGFLGYVPSGSGAEWDGTALTALSGGKTFKWKSMIGMFTLSPVVAYKISDMISVGVTVNFNYGMLQIDRPALGQYSENLTGTGYGATLGLMIKPSEKVSLGLTYKTSTKITAEGEAKMEGAGLLKLTTTATATREINWSMWFGAGVALKPIDKLTITADVQYTNWKNLDDIEVTYDNNAWNLFFAKGSTFKLNWEDRIQYRFGLEYLLSENLAVRAGFYHDPTPAPVDTLSILLPQVDYNSVTFGMGYTTGSLNIEFSFEYVMGKDRECPLTTKKGMPGIHGMNILVPTIALSYKF
jgi:long-chain fatty acid transport protein